MSDLAEVPQELALNEDASDSDDLVRGLVDNDERVVRVRTRALRLEGGLVGCEAWVRGGGEHGEHGDVRAVVVCPCQGPDL